MRLPTTSSELERILSCGRSVCAITAGWGGGGASTPGPFFGGACGGVPGAGGGYSTAHGPVIEGERIQIGLMRVPRGTGGRPHSHPNEQWVYVVQGTLESEVDGVRSRVPSGSLIYIPANVVHSALATPDADVVFLTAKDMSHGILRTPVDTSISAPLYAPGFAPKKSAATEPKKGPGSQ